MDNKMKKSVTINVDLAKQNAACLAAEMQWFESVLNARISHYFEHDTAFDIATIPAPDLTKFNADYANYIREHELNTDERIILILAFIPHIKPELLDTFFLKNELTGRGFTEFGTYALPSHKGILPTVETALFICSANDLAKRLELLTLLDSSEKLQGLGLIQLAYQQQAESPMASAKLILNPEIVSRFILGKLHKPNYSVNFPAQLIESYLTWEDLILPQSTKDELAHILTWLEQENTIMIDWDFKRHIKAGYRALFHGPPGTGKSLSACLLGKRVGMDVYRIDLSALVSKYIGETEKNLAAVFDQAEQKNWILFFDEADALFGKRSGGSSANDRHANQEIAYLLQRIESFDGVIVLASNFKANMDDAFTRRFQSVVYFPMPNANERFYLWQNMLNKQDCMADDLNLKQLAQRYELSGGAMTNVIRFAAIHALQKGNKAIEQGDLVKGIARELRKEGKLIS